MAEKEKTFAELLKESPKGPDANMVSIVGMLGRSEDPKKFVLVLADGSVYTLDVAAVKKHTVLGSSVGRPVVQLELDSKDVPIPPSPHLNQLQSQFHKTPAAEQKIPYADHFTLAALDNKNVLTDITRPTLDFPPIGTVWETVDPGVAVNPAIGMSPFSLAAPHQVAAAQIEMLNNAALHGRRTYLTAVTYTTDHINLFQTHLP